MKNYQEFIDAVEASKKGMKSVKFFKSMDSSIVATKTLIAIQPLIYSPQPLTNVAGDIGKLIYQGMENENMSEGEINKIRIQLGLHILKIFFNTHLFNYKFIDNKSSNSPSKKGTGRYMIFENKLEHVTHKRYRVKSGQIVKRQVVDYISQPLMEEMFRSIAPDDIAIHTHFSYYKPQQRTSFYDVEAGQLVHKVDLNDVDMYSINNIPLVYNAVNRLQHVEYQTNIEVFDTVNAILPTLIHEINNSGYTVEERRGMLRELNTVMDLTKLAKATTESGNVFYQFHYLDFRGRIYPSAKYVNHCAGKMAKAFIKFGKAETIGSSGLFWLKVHAANTWGEDKLSLDDRVDFTDGCLDEWINIANNATTDLRWREADSPYEFLAAIKELSNAYMLDDETTYKSALPIAFDATCSGLQILAALAKSEEVGKLCNVTGSTILGDYYGSISDFVTNNLLTDEDIFWKKHINRSVCKRSAMTYLYSCGYKKMGEHIYNDFRFKIDGLTKELANDLGAMIYAACKMTMPTASRLMELFQELGTTFARKGQDLTVYANYSRFPMKQICRKDITDRVEFNHNGNTAKLRYVVKKGATVDIRDVITSSSPNIVHCLDAQLPTWLANNVDYPLMVQHDSFATNAANAGKLFEDIRIAFVTIFSGNVLEDIFTDAPELIEEFNYGELDVSQVLDNQYFAS